MKNVVSSGVVCLILAAACGSAERSEEPPLAPRAVREAPAPAAEAPPEHLPARSESGETDITAGWAELLGRYRADDGGFRYAALAASERDRASLDSLVERLAGLDLSALEPRAKLAHLIDAYNILTVRAVIARWPIETVMDVPGFFDEATHRVAGRTLTLNGLENEWIRPTFDEPRVHFALNCASTGCPPLAAEPFASVGHELDVRLEALTVDFVRQSTEVDRRRLRISQLFEWYADDFGGAEGARAFVAERLEPERAAAARRSEARLAYVPYDWSINARP